MFREIGLVTGKNPKIAGRDARLQAFWGRFNRGAHGPATGPPPGNRRPAFARLRRASKICVKINF
jgi:hypothetical protein